MRTHKLLNLGWVLGLLSAASLGSAASSDTENDFLTAYSSFDQNRYIEQIKTLSSDEFGGRAPASDGEKKTIDFMVSEFKKLGVKPGNGDSYTQTVPLVAITAEPVKHLTIGNIHFEFRKDYVANSATLKETLELKDSELVFVGYGIVAPEYNWNDYAGLDVKGKTVVILVNDPGFATQDPQLFDGKAMTYYGRWTYKYEEAARQGAAAAIIVHQTAPASYGWNVVESSWSGAQFHLPAGENSAPVVDLEMWITEEKAKAVFKAAGMDFDALSEKAKQPGFKPVPMKLKASMTLKSSVVRSESHNIIATIPGSERPDEHILYTAHWDHIGIDPNKEGDQIYNGALDNATGTAALLQIAEAFQKLKEKPKRSVTFLAVAAEEQGLLGSKYYAANPIYPLNKTVGVINMDSVNVTGLKKNMTVVGFNKSELQEYLAEAGKRQNRELVAEAKPERGGFYRSDHFSLAKKGVPALYAGGGSEPLNEEQAKIAEVVSAHVAKCYHQVCDEYSDIWSIEGAIADIQMFFETGYLLANTDKWPNWHEGTEFKAIRDASLK
jgi:Zn-dependent M28 family amino/carboxypeptidase